MINILFLLLSFLISYFLIKKIIKYNLNHHITQKVREEGLKTHYKKNGTPTMGGLVFILVTVILFLVYLIVKKVNFNCYLIVLLIFPFIGYGLIGFIDDYLKIKKNKNEGLTPLKKFVFQIIISVIYCIIYLFSGYDTSIYILNLKIDLKYFYGIFILLVFLSTTNASNLTDGLDGLLSGTSIIILTCLGYFSLIKQNYIILYFILIFIFSLIGFYCFNKNPAKIFMGDSGSLAIGAVISTIGILLKMEIYLIIIAFPLVFETISVILQVLYYKITKGKRLFKMAPFHHHLEIIGLNENKICLLFYVFEIIFSIITILIY